MGTFFLCSSLQSKLLWKDRQLSKRGANSGMAISPNCLLTTPSLAPVTSSLFCPPQQRSLSSLGRGQRRLCQPRAARPTPRLPTDLPRPRHRAGACLPAHLWGCQTHCGNASAGKGPSNYTGEWQRFTATLPDWLLGASGKRGKSLLGKSECMRKMLSRSTRPWNKNGCYKAMRVRTTSGKANTNLNPGRKKHERICSRMSKGTTTKSQSKLEADCVSSFNKVFKELFALRKTKNAKLIQMSSET